MKIYPKLEETTPLFCAAKIIQVVALLQAKNQL
jgi:hypothetical protein